MTNRRETRSDIIEHLHADPLKGIVMPESENHFLLRCAITLR